MCYALVDKWIFPGGCMLKTLIVLFALVLPSLALAEATKAGSYYVTEDYLEEFLAPSSKAKVTNKIYRGQKVDVLELKAGWARVSRYYNGDVEGVSGNVARWVFAKGLSTAKPADLPSPALKSDTRIEPSALPKVDQNGITAEDLKILHKGALFMLNSGRCSRVEYGDKSVSKPNTYYVNCGAENLFFRPSDIN